MLNDKRYSKKAGQEGLGVPDEGKDRITIFFSVLEIELRAFALSYIPSTFLF